MLCYPSTNGEHTKNEQTETSSLVPSSELLLAVAFHNKVMYQCSWKGRPPPSQDSIKYNQWGTYLKEMLLEKDWGYLGAVFKL